jgi:hypothetical protein
MDVDVAGANTASADAQGCLCNAIQVLKVCSDRVR